MLQMSLSLPKQDIISSVETGYWGTASIYLDIHSHNSDITSWFSDAEYDFWLPNVLKKLNNTLCFLLIDDPLYLPHKKPYDIWLDDSQVRFGKPVHSHPPVVTEKWEPGIHMPIPLAQAVEEVLRVTNEFKDLCWEAMLEHSSADERKAMYHMTGIFDREERYTEKIYLDSKYDWIAEDTYVWGKKRFHDIVKFKTWDEFVHSPTSEGVYTALLCYSWLPLERIWAEYKKEHGITDADVAAAIAEVQKNSPK